MKKAFSYLLDLVFFMVLLSFCFAVYLIASLYLWSALNFNFEKSIYGVIISVPLAIATTVFFYLYLPVKRYGTTVGQSLIRNRKELVKPAAIYFKVILTGILACLVTWAVAYALN